MARTHTSTTPRSDAELLAAHVAGDRDAFAELFRRHHPHLNRLARNTCTSPEDAADVLQEAMLKAHRSAGRFRHHAAVGSWLHRIVVNACVDRLRHNQVHRTLPLEPGADPVFDSSTQIDTGLEVQRALRQLSAEQRAVIVVVELQGHSIAEAAALLEIPEGTVKSRSARARSRLAALLTHPVAEPVAAAGSR